MLFLLLLLSFGAVMVVLNSPYVQTKMGQALANRLTADFGLDVDLDRLEVDFPNVGILKGLVIYDLNKDTLLYVKEFSVQTNRLLPRLNEYDFKSLKLEGAYFHLQTLDTLGTTNIAFLSDTTHSGNTKLETGEKAINDSLRSFILDQYFLSATDIRLIDCRFKYTDITKNQSHSGMDFAHIDIGKIAGRVSGLVLSQDSLNCTVQALSLVEKSGFGLTNFRTKALINPEGIFANELQLTTLKSHVKGDVVLGHTAWDDYGDFTNKIEWGVDISESSLNLGDIGYFTEVLAEKEVDLNFSGRIKGVLQDLKGRDVSIRTDENSFVNASFDISGMSDIANAFIDLRIANSETDYSEIEFLVEKIMGEQIISDGLIDHLKRAGRLGFKGAFTGFSRDFVAYGALQTGVGKLDLDINLKADSIHDRFIYKGHVQTEDLDIGTLTQVNDLGLLTAEAEILAYSGVEFEKAQIDGEIVQLEYSGYTYTNIEVDGEVSKNKFTGEFISRDPNVNLDFLGTVDFSEKIPVVDFYADLYNVDFTALHVLKTDQPFSVSSSVQLKARGLGLNNTWGGFEATDSYVCYGDSVLILNELKLTAAGDVNNRKISLISDIADFNITGAFDAEQLPNSFNRIIGLMFPSLVDSVEFSENEDFQFSANYKKSNVFSGLLVEGLYISPNSTAYGAYSASNETMGLFIRSGEIRSNEISLNGVTVDLQFENNQLDGQVYLDQSNVYGMQIDNGSVGLSGVADSVHVNLGWLNNGDSFRANLGADLHVKSGQKMTIDLLPGFIGNDNLLWEIQSNSAVQLDSTSLFIDDLILKSGIQTLEVDGFLSENPEEELNLNLRDFDFSGLDSTLTMNYNIQGLMNAHGTIKDVYGDRIIFAEGAIKNLKIGKYSFGEVSASSRYFGDDKRMALKGKLNKLGHQMIDFSGSYGIGSERPLEGVLKIDNVDLSLLNAFEIPQVSEYSGAANGEIYVNGDFNQPALDGFIDFDNARFKIEYLNTHFVFSDRVRVEDGWFGIDYKPLYDAVDNKGFLVASAFHENFKNWTYDIDVEIEDFLLLNTSREMNDTYYGTAYGTGDVQLGGYDGFMELNVDATTKKGTSLKLPLEESSDLTMENFVYFVNPDSSDVKERKVDLQGIQMRLNIDATPDAEIQLIFDEKAGDIIRGKGNGKITLEISPSGEFLMFGRYEIEEGSYLFTLRNLVNKQFELRKGGMIGWYGDPYQADLDLSAYYQVRASLYPIMVENQDRYRGRENVNVVLNLKDKLMNPSISFDIELPQSTETERAQLGSVVNTTQQLNQQVFSLLILNRFLPVQASQEEQAVTVTGVGGFGTTTTSDFVSTQISNWLSEISNDFDIGVNYRPGDEISNQEIAVALSTQLFNERLSVSGSFGVTSATETQYTQGQSGILGDFMVEYSLTEDGKIRLKVFNETNPYEVFSTSSSIYTQGVGLIYQEDFDTLDEFFTELKGLFTKDKAEKK